MGDLLEELGCGHYREISETREIRNIERRDPLFIGKDPEWVHVADNFGYTHWRSEVFRRKVRKLAARHSVLSFSIGDIDSSYDLYCYSGGELRRKFVWEDPRINGGHLKEETGSPLDGEGGAPTQEFDDTIRSLWRVAGHLGIETDYTKLDLRAFAAPVAQKKGFVGWFYRQVMGAE